MRVPRAPTCAAASVACQGRERLDLEVEVEVCQIAPALAYERVRDEGVDARHDDRAERIWIHDISKDAAQLVCQCTGRAQRTVPASCDCR